MKFSPSPLPLTALALAGTLVATIPSRIRAAELASDNFSSYANGIALQGQNGGTGFNGGYSVSSPSFGYLAQVRNGAPLSYPNYPTLGGQYANLAGGYGGPAYMDFRRSLDVAGAFSAYNDGTRIGKDGATLWGSFAYHTANGTLNTLLQGAGTTYFALPSNGNADSVYLYKIAFGTGNVDTISFYNNPDIATFNATTAVPTSVQVGDFSFSAIGFAVNGDTFEGRVDNIRFGDNYSDVLPVPEPATWAAGFAGLGCLWASARKRSRRRAA